VLDSVIFGESSTNIVKLALGTSYSGECTSILRLQENEHPFGVAQLHFIAFFLLFLTSCATNRWPD